MKKILRLYYQTSGNNFGDMLSPRVVTAVSGRPCVQSSIARADIAAIGSLMRKAARSWWRRPIMGRFSPLTVWGCGFISQGETITPRNLSILALRGRSTLGRITGLSDRPALGDPGLLVGALFPQKKVQSERGVLIVPHLADQGQWIEAGMQNESLSARLLWPNEPVDDVLSAIANADLVATSAMHPLIAAIAYDRPVIWVDPSDTGIVGGRYKFDDFFSALEIQPSPCSRNPARWSDLDMELLLQETADFRPERSVVDTVVDSVRRSLII